MSKQQRTGQSEKPTRQNRTAIIRGGFDWRSSSEATLGLALAVSLAGSSVRIISGYEDDDSRASLRQLFFHIREIISDPMRSVRTVSLAF